MIEKEHYRLRKAAKAVGVSTISLYSTRKVQQKNKDVEKRSKLRVLNK